MDQLHRLTAEKHDREKHRQTVQRLVELEAEIKRLKCENDTLKRENVAFTDKSNKLRQSLDQAAKYSKTQKQKILELSKKLSSEQQLRFANIQAVGESSDSRTELQMQLSPITEQLIKAKEELNETRQRLIDVQDRLTVAEQVTAATQQRAVQQSDNSEELQLELGSHQPINYQSTL